MGKVNQPSDLISQVRELRRKVEDLVKRVGLSSAVISSGGLLVKDGGTFRMVDDDGVEVVYFGPVVQGESTASGWIFKNDAGTSMFTLSGDEFSQFWALRDSTGRIVASNDASSGAGLGTPWVPLTVPAHIDTLSTQNASYVTVAVSYPFVQHPRIKAYLTGHTSAGAGNMRLLVNGTQLGSAATLGTGAVGLTVDELIPNWGSTVNPFDSVTVELQLRATGGGGAFAFGAIHRLYGAQS